MRNISNVKEFFEKYYDLVKEYAEMSDVPEDMVLADSDADEDWRRWKIIPATVTEDDFAELEDTLSIRFPNYIKQFYSSYFHLFDEPIGWHSSEEPFEGLENAWNPILAKNGYLPFTWDKNQCMIRCIDLKNMPNEDKCVVCEIDHEILFDLDEFVSREDIEKHMNICAENFIDYLNKCYDEMATRLNK